MGSLVTSKAGRGGFSTMDPISVAWNVSTLGNEIRTVQQVWIGPGNAPNGEINPSGIGISGARPLRAGDTLQITRPNGVIFNVKISTIIPHSSNTGYSNNFILETSLYNNSYTLNWFNCYSFGNGVESNRIKDTFNSPFIKNGVKVSTTLDQEYKKEHRKYGLIYSGIYNSNSGVNNLNQFIQAEKIPKDITHIYGSIQKLHAGWGQSGDLLTLCEDKVLKILANKDALFNADGNSNVTSTSKVLGAAIPYSGKFGISKNPGSFASKSYRAYFSDKSRGAIMRLSTDGLTPISDHGMKDWFRDNLKKALL